jgi:uncharacterized protein YdaU (DUF1376 family)
MKNAAPSFQFYPADFLADINVQTMTMEERGIYITLLCHCWIEDGLPSDDGHPIATLLKNHSIAKCFIKKNGKFRNPRLDRERKKQLAYYKSQQEAGLRGAEKRWGRHSKPIATPMAKNSSSSSSSSSKEDSRESSIKAENTGQLFEEFWTNYPREGRFHKKACALRFASIVKAGGLAELKAGFAGYLDHLKDERQKGFDKHPMHVMTFLNKERYMTYKDFKYAARL